MSMNLAFWAGEDGDVEPHLIYQQLAEGKQVEGIPTIEAAEVRAALNALSQWSFDGEVLLPPRSTPEAGPRFDVHIGEQMVEFVAHDATIRQLNTVVTVIRDLGMRLYDPQVQERFI